MAARRFEGDTLVIATHNPGKLREIAELFQGLVPNVKSAGELGVPEPEETGESFAENAALKARHSAEATGLPALADDSGFCVAAMFGEPGIHSARFAGPNRDFNAAMEEIQRRIGGAYDRSAWFICALALAWPDGHVETVEGRIDGTVVWPPRGDKGFGYDPIFMARGEGDTFGEMDPARKHTISHRAAAFRKIKDRCFGA